MKFLRNALDKVKHDFEKGGKWEKYYYVFEAFDTFAFVPNTTAGIKGAQVRDAVDMKRFMMTVVIAMVPCLLFGIFNVGHQHFLAFGQEAGLWEKIWIGCIQVVPVIIVSYATGSRGRISFCHASKTPCQ